MSASTTTISRTSHSHSNPTNILATRLKRFKTTTKTFVAQNLGLLLIAGSQALFASMNTSVQILQHSGSSRKETGKTKGSEKAGMSVLQLIFIRMSFTLIGCIFHLYRIKDPNPLLGPPGVRGLLAIRGVIGFFGLSGMYSSLRYLTLSDATTISFLSPTATAFLSFVILKEAFGRKEAIAGLISLVGVILVARPSILFGDPSTGLDPLDGISGSRHAFLKSEEELSGPTSGQRLGAVFFALMGVLGSSGAYTCIRAIGKRATPFHSIAYFSFYCVVVSGIGMIYTSTKPALPQSIVEGLLIIVIGIFGLGAQVLVTMGLQREKAGRGSLAMYSQLLFAALLEKIVFGVTPTLLSLCGMMIILSAGLWVALSKQSVTPPIIEEHAMTSSPIESEYTSLPNASSNGNGNSNGSATATGRSPVRQALGLRRTSSAGKLETPSFLLPPTRKSSNQSIKSLNLKEAEAGRLLEFDEEGDDDDDESYEKR